jgi:putative FmdB family regulatory protein
MAPLFDYKCSQCDHVWEVLVKSSEVGTHSFCVKCGSEGQVQLSAHATYKIKGDNSASTRPKKG